ncbi:MAG: hypothetical protein ACREYF_10410 [Gammaproteobacteria bacterium]
MNGAAEMRTEPSWQIEEIPALRGLAVEWAEAGRFVLSRQERLFVAASLAPPFKPLGSFPASTARRLAARVRPAQRLLRFMYYNVLGLPGGSFFLTFDKCVGVLDADGLHLLEGLARPCRVLRGACAMDGAGDVYFGEYLVNPDRHEINVYRWVPGSRRIEIVRTFHAGSVRHVHGIYSEPGTRALWCVTGDTGDECRLMRTTDGFRTVDEVGGGDETWRTVSLLFRGGKIFYATDAEFRQNVIYMLDPDTGARDIVEKLDGPVYYSAMAGDDLFFAVTAELCPSQTSRSATLWHVGADAYCGVIASFEKDPLPVSWFLPGTLNFARGPSTEQGPIFQAVALRGADAKTYRLNRTMQAQTSA